jgi:hypothetical protein
LRRNRKDFEAPYVYRGERCKARVKSAVCAIEQVAQIDANRRTRLEGAGVARRAVSDSREYLILVTAAACRRFFPIAFPKRAARSLFRCPYLQAFLPNTGENDDLAVVNRCRPCARAARWFEHNKITHWLFLRILLRVPVEQDPPAAKPIVHH